MQGYLAALTLILLVGLVVFRVLRLSRSGIRAMNFGRMDKSDFLIPPFALFYFYTVFAAAFDLPLVSDHQFWRSDAVAWLGVLLCGVGLLCLLWSLISFGRSFRVGIDTERPDQLVTTGVFAHSRNPIYVGFIAVLLGQFLIFPNWILLAYLIGGAWLINRQVLREEAFLRQQYGAEYTEYCRRVRRYV